VSLPADFSLPAFLSACLLAASSARDPHSLAPPRAVKMSQLDIKRLLVFSAWGGFGFTPIAHNWYNIIEATIPVSDATQSGRRYAEPPRCSASSARGTASMEQMC